MKGSSLTYLGLGITLLFIFCNHAVTGNPIKDLDYRLLEILSQTAIKLDTKIDISKGRTKDECLAALYNISWIHNFVRFNIIDRLEDFILISTRMVDPADERTVNRDIETSITRGLKALETSRESVNAAVGRCSSTIIGSTSGMAFVMPTAQHVLDFFSLVENTLRQIRGRLNI